jgi:hypothetical protein
MGMPQHDDLVLFEFLILEGAQAGVSWDTILRKRENYRAAFDGFDPKIVSRYDWRKPQLQLRDEARKSGWLAQHGENMLHLPLGRIERSGVVDYEIGSFDFFFVGDLRRHAARYFGAGGVFRNSKAAGETQNALFGMASHDD